MATTAQSTGTSRFRGLGSPSPGCRPTDNDHLVPLARGRVWFGFSGWRDGRLLLPTSGERACTQTLVPPPKGLNEEGTSEQQVVRPG